MKCPKCNHSNPPDVLFCHERGRPLAEPPIPPTAQPTMAPPAPTSFVNRGGQVRKFLGEVARNRKSVDYAPERCGR